MGADVDAILKFFDNLAEEIKNSAEQRLKPYE